MSDVVPPALANLPLSVLKGLRVSHQARDEDIERVEAFYAEAGITAEIAPFFTDLPRRMSEAQLVISRAGRSRLRIYPSLVAPRSLSRLPPQLA